MSLLIEGMKLPKNCLLCPCCVGEGIGMGRQHYCQAIEDEPCVSETYRPKNCPLVEISTPHGRLIDAEKLAVKIWTEGRFVNGNDCEIAVDFTQSAPTIIEAEVSE